MSRTHENEDFTGYVNEHHNSGSPMLAALLLRLVTESANLCMEL